MRRLILTATVLMFAAGGAAQPTNTPTTPGVIGSDSPFYTVDILISDVRMRWEDDPPGPIPGFVGGIVGKSAADVVHERASEALVASEAGDEAAREHALQEVNRTARFAHGLEGKPLDQAVAVLREVQDRTPAEAQNGVQTAIDSVVVAGNRFPIDIPAGPGTGGNDAGSSRSPRAD